MLGDDLICLTTFALDASRCAGAMTVARDPGTFADDPFARLFPGTVVPTDLFCAVPRLQPVDRALRGRRLARRALRNAVHRCGS